MSEPTPSPASFSAGRRWSRAFNSVVGIASLLAIVVMVNYLASGWYRRWELSNSGRFDLSPQTTRLLQNVTNDVEAFICFDVEKEKEVHGWSQSLLRQYANLNPRIRVRSIDPSRAPGSVSQILATNLLGTLANKNFILFTCEGRRWVVFANQLSDYSRPIPITGENGQPAIEFRRTNFKGEVLFSSAIFAVSYARQQKAYFVTGHGEHNPEGVSADQDYGKFAAMLRDQYNVPWEKLNLSGTNDLTDASMLVIAGPARSAFTTNELAKLDGYLRSGGRALILAPNMSYAASVGSRSGNAINTGLENYLTNWNVGIVSTVVQDDTNRPAENSLLVVGDGLTPDHPVTQSIAATKGGVLLVLPRPVGRLVGSSTANGPNVERLGQTSSEGIETRDVMANGVLTRKFFKGKFPLIVAVEKGAITGVSADRGTTRLIIIGDSLCLNNQILDSADNRVFAGFAVNWLLDRPQAMLEIPPKTLKDFKITASSMQVRNLGLIMVLGFPGAVLLFGGLVWLRRRR